MGPSACLEMGVCVSLAIMGSPEEEPDSSADFLTLEEVSDLLRVDVETVRRAIHRGEIPAVRVGRIFRVRRVDVLKPYEPGEH